MNCLTHKKDEIIVLIVVTKKKGGLEAMALIKWNREIERPFRNMIDRFFGSDISDYLGEYSGTIPSVNVKESDTEVKIEVAAPGMSKEDFNVSLENDYLVISGNKKEEKESKDEEYSRREFNYHSFQRSFYLPQNMVVADKINAKYENGILHIAVPKTEEAQKAAAKKIEIH